MMDMPLMIAELRRDEAVKRWPYHDSEGILTVGVGHNLQAVPLPVGWTYPLSDHQINQLLNIDITNTTDQLNLHIPWWQTLDEVRQRVICNMAFNLGVARLMQFHLTLASIQKHDYLNAAAEMKNSDWYGQVGARAIRLCTAMTTGIMPV